MDSVRLSSACSPLHLPPVLGEYGSGRSLSPLLKPTSSPLSHSLCSCNSPTSAVPPCPPGFPRKMKRARGRGPRAARGAKGTAARSQAGFSTVDSSLPCPSPGPGWVQPVETSPRAGTYQAVQIPQCPWSGWDDAPQDTETCCLVLVLQNSL